jgi:hypothetical protein
MSKASRQRLRQVKTTQTAQLNKQENMVDSLLDVMEDGKEYVSILDKVPKPNLNLIDDVVKGILAIEAIRDHPCLLYTGNLISKDGNEAGVDAKDDLPFQELVRNVPADQRVVDIYLATNGGSGEQISRFVNYLRARFEEVNFLIPSSCMSAGTLFALSGERIYMTANAFLGPIDPQVPSVGGRFVPAQALLLLVEQLKKDGEEAMKKGLSVPWTAVRLIDSLDKKELGAAITASQWSQKLASQYLLKYKFKNWDVKESSNMKATEEYKTQRAEEIAAALASHDRWKNHGHAISRDVLWSEIQLKIDKPDEALERAMVRLWALLTWLFDKAGTQKLICSSNYRYAINQQVFVRMPQ